MKAKVLFALLGALGAAVALADVSSVITVDLQGPGGHSNGAYGRTNAVHAASRAILEIEKVVAPNQMVISDFNGGNSVNSIASDGHFKVALKAKNNAEMQKLKKVIEEAVKKGVDAENQFRGVKSGDLTGGVPATIRYSIR